jgi:hypothetical protein
MGLGKESFIVELVIRLIWAKALEYDLDLSDGIKLDDIGFKGYNEKGQIKLEFDIHRKTKWKALKNLEKDGYLMREGHRWRMSDRLWNDLKKEIARFKLAEKKAAENTPHV